MGDIKYLRIYSDEEGCSHFEKNTIELKAKDYAPPAPPLNTSTLELANHSVFLELAIGWYGDWHPTPVRQWLILMTGECEFEAGDGERAICQSGDVVLLELLAERCRPPFDPIEAREKVKSAYSRYRATQGENVLEEIKQQRETA